MAGKRSKRGQRVDENPSKSDSKKQRTLGLCGVCGSDEARYKCAQVGCTVVYCSVACYKNHCQAAHQTTLDLVYPPEPTQAVYTIQGPPQDPVTRGELEHVAGDGTVRHLLDRRTGDSSRLRALLSAMDGFKSQRIRERLVEDLLRGLAREPEDEGAAVLARTGWLRELMRYHEWQLLEKESGQALDIDLLSCLAGLIRRILTMLPGEPTDGKI